MPAWRSPGLSIREATTEVSMVSDGPVLAVRGKIVNDTGWPLEVPPLRFVLRDHAGSDLQSWTLSGIGDGRLGPGETASFVSRVAAPAQAASEVEIRFARED